MTQTFGVPLIQLSVMLKGKCLVTLGWSLTSFQKKIKNKLVIRDSCEFFEIWRDFKQFVLHPD